MTAAAVQGLHRWADALAALLRPEPGGPGRHVHPFLTIERVILRLRPKPCETF